jgi:hypothetical protein
MNGPTNIYRQQVFNRLKELPNTAGGVRVVTPQLEARLEGILSDILRAASEDVESSRLLRTDNVDSREADQLVAAIDQWASVASFAVSWLYAPQSPSVEKMAGWAKKIGNKLREIAGALLRALVVAAKSLGATSWSIGVNFPLGMSVSLTWS